MRASTYALEAVSLSALIDAGLSTRHPGAELAIPPDDHAGDK